MTYAVCIRGQGGWFTSQGMDRICTTLREMGTKATIWNWDTQQAIYNYVLGLSKSSRLAIIGYSLGATHAPKLCRELKRDVDLLIGVDPSAPPLSGVVIEPVPQNVERAIAFYNTRAWYFGGKKYSGHNVTNIPIAGNIHLGMDWDPRIVNRILTEVRGLNA